MPVIKTGFRHAGGRAAATDSAVDVETDDGGIDDICVWSLLKPQILFHGRRRDHAFPSDHEEEPAGRNGKKDKAECNEVADEFKVNALAAVHACVTRQARAVLAPVKATSVAWTRVGRAARLYQRPVVVDARREAHVVLGGAPATAALAVVAVARKPVGARL